MGKAKGTTLLGAVKFIRSKREEGRRALPEQLHDYLNQRVSPSAWYPEEDLLGLIRAMLALIPGPSSETLQLMGQVTAREHYEGIYSHLMEGGAGASSTFALWSAQHDTGKLRVTREGPQATRIDLVGYANPSLEMCAIIGAYVVEVLRLGGLNASGEKIACQLSGDESCSWRCSWTRSDASSEPERA